MSERIDGKRVEVHEDRFGKKRYWAAIDGLALFQRGRMRLRMFSTLEVARKAAREALKEKP
jgi:hypothetical protein